MRHVPTQDPRPAGRRRRRSLVLLSLTLLLGGTGFFAAKGSHAPAPKDAFSIHGNLRPRLHPGTSAPVNLVLFNRRHFALGITNLKVRIRIDRRHARAGCSARRDYRIAQLKRRAYPIRIRAGDRRRLTGLGVRRKNLPRIKMINRATRNQDACKGAKLKLVYSGAGRRWGAGPR